MQILLTHDEWLELKGKANSAVDERELQKLCTLAANHIPVPQPWRGKGIEGPWGCILDKAKYCDDCPADKLCPNPHKEWSQ